MFPFPAGCQDKTNVSSERWLPASLPLTFRNPDTNFVMHCPFEKLSHTSLREHAWSMSPLSHHLRFTALLTVLLFSNREGASAAGGGDCLLTLSTATELRKRLTQPQRLSVGTVLTFHSSITRGSPVEVYFGVHLYSYRYLTLLFPSPHSTTPKHQMRETQSPREFRGLCHTPDLHI